MRREHALDARSACAPVEAGDDLPLAHEDEGGDVRDVEAVGELARLLDVDPGDAQPPSLLAREVGEKALHAPAGARALRSEEEEEREVEGRVHRKEISLLQTLQNGSVR